ncbi:MAG: hypothetical protein IJ429_00490 [Lachnospiraceae bacterium]|nr:hypothetical protein [Lachnospiraceae bacterium]
MKEQWKKYLDVVEEHRDFDYTHIMKKRISDVKEKWVGGVFFDGNIYGIVNSERKGVCISPEKQKYFCFGNVKVGTFKWTGGCAYRGKIYGFPRKENSLLVVDPKKKELMVHKLPINYRGEHHYGGVCTKDGIVYQPPRDTNHILCIDLNTYQTRTIKIKEEGTKCRYVASVQHPNGDIYMLPEKRQKILVLHPETEEWEYLGEETDCSVFGAVVGYDGNIYGYCNEGEGLLKINAEKKCVENICTEIGEPDSYGSVVGVNGKIYSIPARSKQIWEFDIKSQAAKEIFQIEEKGVAKCAGAGVGCDGTICMIPAFGEYLYFLMPEKSANISADRMNNPYMNTSY